MNSRVDGARALRVWLVAVGEPLPTDPGHLRLLRMGILAGMLGRRGHEVVWWTSAFDHQLKRHREPPDAAAMAALEYEVRLLHGCGYARNVSLARIRDQRMVAAEFAARIRTETVPDVILASYPTIELCERCVDYGREHGVPVVIDARDMWPDIFLHLTPPALRAIARMTLAPMFRASQRALAGASALYGITDAFVDWACARAGRPRTPLDGSFPLAYDLDAVDAAAIARARLGWAARGLAGGDRTFCFFGTLGRQFDIPTVLRAASLLKGQGYRFVVCGAGDRLPDFQRLAAGLDNVMFPGWVDAASIRALMEQSIAGLAPYRNEPSFTLSVPNKAIEYLAGGLPVITCLDGELRQLIEARGCGAYWREGDEHGLAALLQSLAADPARRQCMADNARRTFDECFAARAVYGRLVDRLIDLGRRHPR